MSDSTEVLHAAIVNMEDEEKKPKIAKPKAPAPPKPGGQLWENL